MKAITQKLGITETKREDQLFSFYLRWCESVTTNSADFQAVLANSAVNAWFMMELAKLEDKFQKLTERYEGSTTVSADDFKECYTDVTEQMFNIRPMALLEQVKIKRPKGAHAFNQLYQN